MSVLLRFKALAFAAFLLLSAAPTFAAQDPATLRAARAEAVRMVAAARHPAAKLHGGYQGRFEEDVVQALVNRGLPLLSYKLLTLFAKTKVCDLGSILSCVGKGTIEELPDEFLLLLGFSFLDVHWNIGTMPHFELNQTGQKFFAYLTEDHSALFAAVQVD